MIREEWTLSTQEIAEILGWKTRSARQWLARQKIPFYKKPNGLRAYRAADLVARLHPKYMREFLRKNPDWRGPSDWKPPPAHVPVKLTGLRDLSWHLEPGEEKF